MSAATIEAARIDPNALPCEIYDYIDGPGLRSWLLERHPEINLAALGGSALTRRWSDWAKPGNRATYVQADTLLTKLGHHLHELPDELWVDSPQRFGASSRSPIKKQVPLGVRRQAVARVLRGGEPRDQVARAYGVSKTTLRYWIDKEAENA